MMFNSFQNHLVNFERVKDNQRLLKEEKTREKFVLWGLIGHLRYFANFVA